MKCTHPLRCLCVLLLVGCGAEQPDLERWPEASGELLAYAAPAPAESPVPAASPDASDGRVSADTLPAAPPPWSPEGFEMQPHLRWLQQYTPPELGYSPGTTPWRPARPDLPSHLTRRQEAAATSPGALLAEMALALEWGSEVGEGVWEQTFRLRQEAEDRTVAMVLHWGLQDDAVAGHDLRVRLRATDGRWYVEQVEERFHCSRGVTAEGICG
jgi:hypothetical protein